MSRVFNENLKFLKQTKNTRAVLLYQSQFGIAHELGCACMWFSLTILSRVYKF